jgi:hypothetical protein
MELITFPGFSLQTANPASCNNNFISRVPTGASTGTLRPPVPTASPSVPLLPKRSQNGTKSHTDSAALGPWPWPEERNTPERSPCPLPRRPRRDGHGLPPPTRTRRPLLVGGVGRRLLGLRLSIRLCLPVLLRSAQQGCPAPAAAAAKAAGAGPRRYARGRERGSGWRRRAGAGRPRAASRDVVRGRPRAGACTHCHSLGLSP